MKKAVWGILAAVLLLAACGKEESEKAPAMLEVDLKVSPESAEPEGDVTFTAKVTYEDKAVTKADEVTFEIWRANDEKHEKAEPEQVKDGVYQLKERFTQEGTYYVYAHVTAKDQHNMPKKEFVVGKASEPEDDSKMDSNMDMEGMDHH